MSLVFVEAIQLGDMILVEIGWGGRARQGKLTGYQKRLSGGVEGEEIKKVPNWKIDSWGKVADQAKCASCC